MRVKGTEPTDERLLLPLTIIFNADGTRVGYQHPVPVRYQNKSQHRVPCLILVPELLTEIVTGNINITTQA